MLRFISAILILTWVGLVQPLNVNALESQSPPKGLSISPAVNFQTVEPGKSYSSSIQLQNNTSNELSVDVAVQQFSIKNYSYSYIFNTPHLNWIKISKVNVVLAPAQSVTDSFLINIPSSAAPGGYYFTVIASAKFVTGSITSVGQAASLQYITVAGKLTYTNHILSNNVQHLSFGSPVTYKFTILGTGNTYFYTYTYARLAKKSTTAVGHIIYPLAPRTFSGSITPPVLPGLYKIHYGYTASSGKGVNETSWVVYLPPWIFALIFVVLLVITQTFTIRKRKPNRLKRRP